jgi:hypothetical protein
MMLVWMYGGVHTTEIPFDVDSQVFDSTGNPAL